MAIESALLVGWPVGWALASLRLAESGEARALQALGERPMKTVSRLAPQALFFAAAIASMAVVWGRDANEPGRVATELIASQRVPRWDAELGISSEWMSWDDVRSLPTEEVSAPEGVCGVEVD